MKLRWAWLALTGVVVAVITQPALAQWSPTRAIRFIVPYSTGTATDTISRAVAQKLSESLGQQVIVDNLPGANGIVGTEVVAKAPKDGHTLGMIAANHVVTPALYRKLPYDTIRDFTPVTILGAVPFVLVVHPSVPARSVKELIALAKARPGQLLYASAGNGSPPHLAGELLKTMAGIDIVHVPYKGLAPGLTDAIAGQVSLIFPAISAALPQAKAGKLRAFAVTSLKRSTAAPELPTMDESGLKGYEVYSWIGIMGPSGLPKEVVSRLHAEGTRIIKLPDISQRFGALGIDIIGTGPDEFARIMQADLVKFGKIVRASGAKID
ncbi:MAG TPA: tripartite tricarboxylate transporter substrate binding protein [Burkholderiales bacterium]|nr:tripartite tricarboxylate transporter substrate binding protein [Burkholderiales bacterium]